VGIARAEAQHRDQSPCESETLPAAPCTPSRPASGLPAASAQHQAVVLLLGLDPRLGEELLRPGEPVWEYWGHEASWLPIETYPWFAFRRRQFRHHPWWGDIVGQHPKEVRRLRKRIREEGPIRSVDMEGRGSRGWWDLKLAKKIATALWSSAGPRGLDVKERGGWTAFSRPCRRIPPPSS